MHRQTSTQVSAKLCRQYTHHLPNCAPFWLCCSDTVCDAMLKSHLRTSCRRAAAEEAAARTAELKEAVAGYQEEAEDAAAEAKRILQTLKCAPRVYSGAKRRQRCNVMSAACSGSCSLGQQQRQNVRKVGGVECGIGMKLMSTCRP